MRVPTWRATCLAVLLFVPPTPGRSAVDLGELATLRAADRHDAAAELGLRGILEQPWDHSLRYLVADSLERAGRFDEASAQFSALHGTPLQGAAQGRLATLAGRTDHRSPALPAATIATPGQAATAPALAPPRSPTTAATVARPAMAVNQTARAASASAPAPAQPRRLGAPASLAPPATSTASAPASAQPRRLGAPASLPQPATLAEGRPSTSPPIPPAQHIEALYAKGDYAEAGAQGLALLEKAPIDAELHLKVANSLAWSGKLQAGQAQYRALFDSKVDREARLALANTQRWNARFDLAMAGYQAVLDRHPDDSDALEGMRQSRLGLAPRTTFGAEYTTDINPVERRGATLGHRWHNASGDTRYEVKVVRYDDSIDWVIPANGLRDPEIPRRAETRRQSLSASMEMLAHPLQPQLMLSLQQQVAIPPPPLPARLAALESGPQVRRNDDAIFGTARIKLYEWPVWFRVGRLDWSHEALAPRAAIFGLVARHSGLEALGEFDWGQLYGQVDYYGITDGNSISAAQLRWTPSWRPLGARWRPLLGLEWRQAMRPAAEYWSPSLGHGSAYAGLSGDWTLGRWSLYGSAQYGTPLLEESGTSWSLSLGGRYQVAEDLAFSFGFWRMSSFRDNAAYRARTANLQVEKAWR